MNVQINKGKAKGTVSAPPSKSYSHRMIICAALATGTSTLTGFSESQDMLATLDCIKNLGATFSIDGSKITITGIGDKLAAEKKSGGLEGEVPAGSATGGLEGKAADGNTSGGSESSFTLFPCRESGSTLRFFIPIALAATSSARFAGTSRLIERGIGVYEELFQNRNITVSKETETIVLNGHLTSGTFELPGNVSSQFISGLMFALPLLEQDSTIKILPPVESAAYIQMTIDVLATFGITIQKKSDTEYFVPGNQKYQPKTCDIEGDWSNAVALFAFGDEVKVTGLNYQSSQGDKVCLQHIDTLNDNPESEIDLANCPDLAPVLFAYAAAHNGGNFTGTARLKIKESDRATVMQEELAKFGIKVDVLENSVKVHKAPLQTPAAHLDSHNDHRIVMAMAYLSSITGGYIECAEAVNKSFPDYFEKLTQLGLEVVYDI